MKHFLSVILTILNNLWSDIYLFEYVHVKEDYSDAWYFLSNISVKYLSPDPDIPENLLKGLGGSLTLKVFVEWIKLVVEIVQNILWIYQVLLTNILKFLSQCTKISLVFDMLGESLKIKSIEIIVQLKGRKMNTKVGLHWPNFLILSTPQNKHFLVFFKFNQNRKNMYKFQFISD